MPTYTPQQVTDWIYTTPPHRTFTPDKPTAQAIAALAAFNAAQQHHADAEDDLSSSSEPPSEGLSAHEGESMEIAGDEPTRAFGGHFAGTNVPVDVDEDDDADGQDPAEAEEYSFGDESGDGSMEMDEATGEITRAFAAQGRTALFNSLAGVGQPGPGPVAAAASKPRFSVMVRQDDADDEEALRELGVLKPGVGLASAPKAVGFGDVPSSGSESESDADDDADAMDETTALDGLISQTIPAAHDDSDDNLFDESMMDATTDMQDATTYGGILAPTEVLPTYATVDGPVPVDSAPQPEPQSAGLAEAEFPQGVVTPSTPSARLQAAMFARQAQAASQNAAANPPVMIEPPRSPRRVSPAPQAVARSPPPSAPPPSLAVLPPKSPARRMSLAPTKSPSAPRIGSPLKASFTNPPSSTPPRPTTPQRAEAPRLATKGVLTPHSGRTMLPTTPKSASKVALPPSTPNSPRIAFGTAITPRSGPGALALGSTFTPKVPEPVNGTKSLGVGLGARPAVMARSPRKSLAPVAAGAGLVARGVEAIKDVTLAETEEDLTGSSFGVYNDEPVPLEPISLDDFFDQTGTGFAVKDIVGMTGIDLNSTSAPSRRRMSMAPSKLLSGAPSFADLAVAGGCKSLFHQLYTADQTMLEREIRAAMTDLGAWDDQLESAMPQIFDEWGRASDAQRETMRSQFREIKMKYYLKGRVEWNEYRSDNYAQIIGVMEDNLAGLQHDAGLVAELEFEAVLPELEARRAALLDELHAERARDLELSACDQAELAQLRADADEQAAALEVLENGHAEACGRLAALEGQAGELLETREALERDRAGLERSLDEGRCFTKAEVFRLQAEYDALQDLHGWRMDRFAADGLAMTHFDVVQARFELDRGLVTAVAFTLLPDAQARVAPPPALAQLEATLTQFLFDKLALHVSSFVAESGAEAGGTPLRPVLHRIAALWTNARRLRREARLVHLRHPTLAHLVGLAGAPEQELRLCSEVHSRAAGATVFVVFELTGEELLGEGEGEAGEAGAGREEDVLARVGSEVVLKWGRADVETLKYVVRERLDTGERGAFVGACDEVEAKAGEMAAARA